MMEPNDVTLDPPAHDWPTLIREDRRRETKRVERVGWEAELNMRRHDRVKRAEMRTRLIKWILVALVLLGVGASVVASDTLDVSDRAYGHPVYTQEHVDEHVRRYQELIRQQAQANRLLRFRLREARVSGGRVSTSRWALKSAVASWYGPCCYGNHTANGTPFTATTRGVAHRTLPFGTRCLFIHGGRAAIVKVIDRGPHVAGRTFDLTAATASYLRFSGVGSILYACNA